MKPPAFRFYVDNFIEGTVEMTDSEVGLYMRLLCAQWSKGSLPNDDSELLRFSRGSTTALPDLNRIKKKFVIGEDGQLRNERLEIERSKQVAFSQAQAAKGSIPKKPRLNPCLSPVKPSENPPKPSVSVSVSSGLEREAHLPECNGHPTLKEVLSKAAFIGLAAWKAEDWFNEMSGCGWLDHAHRPIQDWTAVLTRVRVKWESDGRPASPPKPRNPSPPKQADIKFRPAGNF